MPRGDSASATAFITAGTAQPAPTSPAPFTPIGLFAVGTGLSLSTLGGGGSIITVPVPLYAAEQSPQQALPMSLAIVGAVSAIGTAIQARVGLVHWKAVLMFGAAGIPGAWIGAQLTHFIAPAALLLMFAGLMLLVAAKMWFGKKPVSDGAAHCQPLRCPLAGAVVGFVTGFLGVGGGFLLVPALAMAAHLPIKTAVGTSLAIIALNSLGGLMGHAKHGGLNWHLTLLFFVAALVGTVAGIPLARRISADALTRGFAVFVAAVAIFVVAEN